MKNQITTSMGYQTFYSTVIVGLSLYFRVPRFVLLNNLSFCHACYWRSQTKINNAKFEKIFLLSLIFCLNLNNRTTKIFYLSFRYNISYFRNIYFDFLVTNNDGKWNSILFTKLNLCQKRGINAIWLFSLQHTQQCSP